jgi:hypothetical protein
MACWGQGAYTALMALVRTGRRIVATVLALGLAHAGCGGGDDSSGAPSDRPAESPEAPSASADAAKLLYDALGNAAHQTTIRVAMHRATFATEADARDGRRRTAESSTVSEIDTEQGHYRSAYATRVPGEDGFTVGRCVDGADYRDFARLSDKPASLARAERLLGRLQKASAELPFSPCPHVGLINGASPDLALARLSDGVFPVTLTEPQARRWVSELAAAELFDVVDEGMVRADGRELRKLRFTTKASIPDANQRLYDIFAEAGEIEKLARMKKRNPKIEFAYEFISIGVANHGSIRGHYLIDPEAELPVSSELEGTATPGEGRLHEWARTRQRYAFPERLSLTASSRVDLPAP